MVYTKKLPKSTLEKNKQAIISLFMSTIRGKKSNTIKSNQRHDGKDGHWLEIEMGLKLNSSNSPDYLGFEMKNHTSSKTTFGDWSANYYIFNNKDKILTRDEFLGIFGKPNTEKGGRLSWSGKPAPQIQKWNDYGQRLIVDNNNNIIAAYRYTKDKRPDKEQIVPIALQKEDIVLARWDEESLRRKLESKFNQNGWFKCLKNKEGVYYKIVFGKPISFNNWINLVKTGDVFFDSGMYQGNMRPYSQWRSSNKFWVSMVSESYE